MTYDQISLGVILIFFLLTFLAIMALVRQQGHDPKGAVDSHLWGAVVTSVASLLWLAVALFYVFAARSVDWFGRIVFFDTRVVKGVGVALSTFGLVVGIAGEFALGKSFCLAFPKEKTALVTRGIYGYIRNPCVSGVFLLVMGTFFIAPSLLALFTLVVNVIGYEMKVRAEEAYLRRMHGTEYEAYCARTGRYLPVLRRKLSPR